MSINRIVILIIEDSRIDQEAYQRLIEQDSDQKYSLLFAETGEKGLEICQTNQVDCILLDYRLPDSDGLEFLTEFSEIATKNRPPVIFLTGPWKRK